MTPQENVPLAPLTTFGVGGAARFFVRVHTTAELVEAFEWARARGTEIFVLGGGSNLVVSDRGLDALVVQMASSGLELHERQGAVRAVVAAGENWDGFVERACSAGLAGVECLSGIPGLVGATPIQNVGAYGQEVSDTIVEVGVVDRATGAASVMTAAACELGYRDSIFKRSLRGRFVVTTVTFDLHRGHAAAPRYAELQRAIGTDPREPTEVRSVILELRRAKAMVLEPGGVDSRSAGSFFMNPIVDAADADTVESRARDNGALSASEKMPRFAAGDGRVKLAAGWLIERAGFTKGTHRGAVGLSTKHALALVNRGGAAAQEVVDFARWIRDGVFEHFGVRLVPEPELVGFPPDEIDDLTRPI